MQSKKTERLHRFSLTPPIPSVWFPGRWSWSLAVHGIFQARILEWASFPPPGDLPDPGIQLMFPVSPALAADSLPSSHLGFPGGSAGKEFTWNVGDLGSIPRLGRSREEGKGYSLQYSGLKNFVDCVVLGVAKSQTWLNNFHHTTSIWEALSLPIGISGFLVSPAPTQGDIRRRKKKKKRKKERESSLYVIADIF